MVDDDVRRLAAEASSRWSALHLTHRSEFQHVEAWLVHGEVRYRELPDGPERRSTDALLRADRAQEPIVGNYVWAAMLDPTELAIGVALTDVTERVVLGRPCVEFTARAGDGYDPTCSCCPLVLSEQAARLEYGDAWRERITAPLPKTVRIALDMTTGVVVKVQHTGAHQDVYFENVIHSATLATA